MLKLSTRNTCAMGALAVAMLGGPGFAQTEKRPADFVLEKIEVPENSDGMTFEKGTAAERQQRLKTLGSSYDEGRFNLSGLPTYRPQSKVTGKLRVWGNNYIENSGLGDAWAAEFKKHHPGLEVELVLPTAAMATGSLYFGVADVAITHEPTFYDTLSHVRVMGYEPTGFMAFTGSYDTSGWMNTMAIAVHQDVPIDSITIEQLDGIFGSQRQGGWDGFVWNPSYARGPEKDIRTWSQLGVQGKCANQPIVPIGYAVVYATATEFSRRVLKSSGRWNDNLRDYGNFDKPDGSKYIQYFQIVDELKKNPCGIAYVRYQKPIPGMKMLKLAGDSNSEPVEFTIDNVFNRTYPLSGEMSFYTSVKPGTKMDPKVKEWLSFILSREGQNLIQVVDRKYLPLNARTAAEERARLAKF
jgi:phosphate transport system substrate-binding protein